MGINNLRSNLNANVNGNGNVPPVGGHTPPPIVPGPLPLGPPQANGAGAPPRNAIAPGTEERLPQLQQTMTQYMNVALNTGRTTAAEHRRLTTVNATLNRRNPLVQLIRDPEFSELLIDELSQGSVDGGARDMEALSLTTRHAYVALAPTLEQVHGANDVRTVTTRPQTMGVQQIGVVAQGAARTAGGWARARDLFANAGPALSTALQNVLTMCNITPQQLLDLDRLPYVNPVVNELMRGLGVRRRIRNSEALMMFMKVISQLGNDPRDPRQDDQMLAIALARLLVRQMNFPHQPMRVLEVMAETVQKVSRAPHEKSLRTEVDAAREDVARHRSNGEVRRAVKTLGGSVAKLFKQDKPVNKAINLLDEALKRWIGNNATLDPRLAQRIIDLLKNLPQTDHLGKLYRTFLPMATPLQANALRDVLQARGRSFD